MTINSTFGRVLSWVVPSDGPPRRAGVPPQTDVALIPGHKVDGHKVAAYETHWVAGFEFSFAFIPWPFEKYRIYILRSPSYGRRDGGSEVAHWLSDHHYDAKFVCVDHSVYPDTLTDARNLALMWAQATARYIKTGRKFS